MPELDYRNTTASSTTETTSQAVVEEDLQDTLGNEALATLMASQSNDSADLQTLWDEAATEQTAQAPDLVQGKIYTITDADLVSGPGFAWREIARAHGMTEEKLKVFNQQIISVRDSSYADTEHLLAEAADIATGIHIYIPSADEILFAQCAQRAESMDEAVSLWNEMAGAHNLEMLRTARSRASGDVGLGYGTAGDEGIFYSPNPELAGASEKRTEVIDDAKNYRVNWGADFWKCSLFMHDVVYGAGYQPDMLGNDHYQLAGRLQESEDYEEISVNNARPGDCWQRFGGTQSDESHNAILSSFVEVKNVDEENDFWSFSIIGAENSRAAESDRSHTMKKGTNENIQGKIIRFFRPRVKRTTAS